MKVIIINSEKHGIKEVLVDDEDFEALNKHRWGIDSHNGLSYASRTMYISGRGKSRQEKRIRMHRVIMKAIGSKMIIDHKDHNTFNNQKSNLRIVTRSQNGQNRTSAKGSASPYLGVSLDKSRKTVKYVARLRGKGLCLYLGSYKNEWEAALAYDTAAKKHYGEFANLNFKNDDTK